MNVRVCAAPDSNDTPEGRLSVITKGEGMTLGVRVTLDGITEPVIFRFQNEKQFVTNGGGVTTVDSVVVDNVVKLELPLTVTVGQTTCKLVDIGVIVIVVDVLMQVGGKMSWHGGLHWTVPERSCDPIEACDNVTEEALPDGALVTGAALDCCPADAVALDCSVFDC